MAKGDICRVEGCIKLVSIKQGTKCDKHYKLWQKYKSHDEPIKPKLPEGIIKICKKHGELTKEDCYLQGKHREKYQYWYCKKCILDLNIKTKYKGMNGLEDLEVMLESQNGVCVMCKGENNTTRNGKVKRYNIDHCHSCEEPRGALCSFCNSLLGYAKDDIKILKAAIRYLECHNEKFHLTNPKDSQ